MQFSKFQNTLRQAASNVATALNKRRDTIRNCFFVCLLCLYINIHRLVDQIAAWCERAIHNQRHRMLQSHQAHLLPHRHHRRRWLLIQCSTANHAKIKKNIQNLLFEVYVASLTAIRLTSCGVAPTAPSASRSTTNRNNAVLLLGANVASSSSLSSPSLIC